MFPRKRHQMRNLFDLPCLLEKQVFSQLSYTPTEAATMILRHLPPFCIPALRKIVIALPELCQNLV